MLSLCFFFNDTATTEIYTLSLHDALPILVPQDIGEQRDRVTAGRQAGERGGDGVEGRPFIPAREAEARSEEHTSELQSRQYLVCRLLLEKKKTNKCINQHTSESTFVCTSE